MWSVMWAVGDVVGEVGRGLLAMAAGHYADAVTRFEECLAENPSNVQVRAAP